MKKAYKYRLYPNKAQEQKFLWTLERCRELYNAALQERREAYRMQGVQVGFYIQSAQLLEIKQVREEYTDIYAQVLQDVLRRVHKNMLSFSSRIKAGEKAGYPRFQSYNRYDSFTYPQVGPRNMGPRFEDKKLFLPKIGSIKIKLHRKIAGKIKTVTIKREGEQWYAVFTCEIEAQSLPVSSEDIGIDLGITHLAALSNGEFIDNPRYYRKAEKKLQKHQQSLSHKKKDSHRREKAKRLVARAHRKIRNQRKDFLHKQSRIVINQYQMIALEELPLAKLIKRPAPKPDENGRYLHNGASRKVGLNKSIQDAGWGIFQQYCMYKAAEAGRVVLLVDRFETSQLCSRCHKKGLHKELSDRVHNCPHCGLVLDRDTNAAINILKLGRSLQSAMVVKAS